MIYMSDYIFLLSSVSVFCGIIHILAPKGEGGALRDNVRLVSALALLCVALFPIGGFLTGLKNTDLDFSDIVSREELTQKYDENFCAAMKEYSEEETERAAEKILFDRFGLKEGDIEIKLYSSVENDNIKIERADIVIYFGGIMQDPKELSDAITELLTCECRIIYK